MCPEKPDSKKLPSTQPTGKVVHTDQGTAKWVFANQEDEDTQRILKALSNDDLALEESDVKAEATPFNPYNKPVPTSTTNEPRRSLDDLRKLSEQIKNNKNYVRPSKETDK